MVWLKRKILTGQNGKSGSLARWQVNKLFHIIKLHTVGNSWKMSSVVFVFSLG